MYNLVAYHGTFGIRLVPLVYLFVRYNTKDVEHRQGSDDRVRSSQVVYYRRPEKGVDGGVYPTKGSVDPKGATRWNSTILGTFSIVVP